LFELIMAQGGGKRATEEDAMFTKKPLGGLSCASCERNITNLAGVMAEYQPWKKLPFREANDRLSRVISALIYINLVWSWFLKNFVNDET
jgi:hypothetical protein